MTANKPPEQPAAPNAWADVEKAIIFVGLFAFLIGVPAALAGIPPEQIVPRLTSAVVGYADTAVEKLQDSRCWFVECDANGNRVSYRLVTPDSDPRQDSA